MSGATTEIGARLRLRDHREYINNLSAAENAHRRFNETVNRTSFVGRAASGVLSGLQTVAGAVGSTVLTLGTRLASVAAVAGGAFATMGLKTASAYEQAEVAFGSMLHNGQMAKQLVAEIEKFAIESPFGFPEVLETSRSLKAMGIEASQIIPIMETIGDAASGLGLGSSGIERIGRALGQINAKGFPSGEEMRQLADAGVTAWKYLAEAQGQSIQKTMAQAERRAISGGDAITAILAGINKDFNGLTEQIAENTLAGVWEVFTDKVRRASRLAIKPFMGDLRNMLNDASVVAEKVAVWFGEEIPAAIGLVKWGYWGKELGDAAGSAQTRLYALGRIIGIIFGEGTWQDKLREGVHWLRSLIDPSDSLRPIWDYLGGVFEDVATIWNDALLPAFRDAQRILPPWTSTLWLLATVLDFAADHATELRRVVEVLAVLWAGYRVLKLYSDGVHGLANAYRRSRDFARGLREANALLAKAMAKVWNSSIANAIRFQTMRLWEWVVAQLAASGSTTGLAIAISLLYAALGIGLIVALVAAYQHIGWFHDAVDKAWQTVQKAWDWINNHKLIVAAALWVTFGPVTAIIASIILLHDKLKAVYDLITGNKDVKISFLGFDLERKDGKTKVQNSAWDQTVKTTLTNLPGVGGFFRQIPGFAMGGTVRRSGPVVVGENGPELRYEHAGAVIQPIKRTSDSVGSNLAKAIGAAVSGGSDGTFRVVDGHRVLFELVREAVGDTAARK